MARVAEPISYLLRVSALSLLLVLLAIAVDIGWGHILRKRSPVPRASIGAEAITRFHPERAWTTTPNFVRRHREAGQPDVVYSIDADGYRVTPKRGEATQRLFFFGDSFTFGAFVDDRAVFSSRIASEFVGPGVHVFNAGVSGYGVIQAVQRFLEIAEDLTPRDIVAFTPISSDLRRTLNDFEHTGRMLLHNPELVVFPSYREGTISPVRVDTLWMRLRAMLYSAPMTGQAFVKLNRARAQPVDTADALALLDMARMRAEERGAKFALFFLPKASELQKGRYKVDVSRFDHFDIRPLFPSDPASIAAMRFPDDGHWTCFAHAHGAKAIATTLAEQGWLQLVREDLEPSLGCARMRSGKGLAQRREPALGWMDPGA